jgi:hypothetical protein
VRDAEDKCCTTCRNKRQRRHHYSAYRCGSHDTRPLARSSARQRPRLTVRRFVPVITSAQPGIPSVSRADQCAFAGGVFLPGSKRERPMRLHPFIGGAMISYFSGLAFGLPFNMSRCTRIRSRDGEGNQIFPEAGG